MPSKPHLLIFPISWPFSTCGLGPHGGAKMIIQVQARPSLLNLYWVFEVFCWIRQALYYIRACEKTTNIELFIYFHYLLTKLDQARRVIYFHYFLTKLDQARSNKLFIFITSSQNLIKQGATRWCEYARVEFHFA